MKVKFVKNRDSWLFIYICFVEVWRRCSVIPFVQKKYILNTWKKFTRLSLVDSGVQLIQTQSGSVKICKIMYSFLSSWSTKFSISCDVDSFLKSMAEMIRQSCFFFTKRIKRSSEFDGASCFSASVERYFYLTKRVLL